MPDRQSELLPITDESAEISPFSVVAPIVPILDSASRFFFDKVLGPYSEKHDEIYLKLKTSLYSTTVRWQDPSIVRASNKAVVALAGHISQRAPNPNEEQDVINEVRERSVGFNEDVEVNEYFAYGVLASIEMVRILRTMVANSIAELSNDSPGQQFEIMKLLASPLNLPPETNHRLVTSLQLLNSFNIADGQRVTKALPAQQWLVDGVFDSFIAKELLEEAAGKPNEDREFGLRPAAEMALTASMIEGFDPGSDTFNQGLRDMSHPSSLVRWSDRQKAVLEFTRDEYIRAIAEADTKASSLFDERRCVLPPATEADVEVAFNGLVVAVAKQKSSNTYLSKRERAIAHSTLMLEQKRKVTRSNSLPTDQDDIHEDTAGEKQMEPRKLSYMTPSGEIVYEGTPDYDEFIEDFNKRHFGDPALISDAEAYRNYLRTVTLSNGLVRGIRKLQNSEQIQRGETIIDKVYQFKPTDTPGLSRTSPNSRRIRMLFVLTDGGSTIAFLDMGLRRNSRQMKSRNGIPGRDRRK